MVVINGQANWKAAAVFLRTCPVLEGRKTNQDCSGQTGTTPEAGTTPLQLQFCTEKQIRKNVTQLPILVPYQSSISPVLTSMFFRAEHEPLITDHRFRGSYSS